MIVDDPPRISITRNTTDWSNEYESGLTNLMLCASRLPASPAYAPARTKATIL